jgi:transposase
VLSSVSKHLAKFGIAEGAYIYIADSAVVTEENLKQMGDSILFITRLPATYNECARVVREAVKKDEWEDIGVLSETKPTKNRPAAHYKLHESEVELYGKKYRSIVVHSSAHDKRRKKRIDRELETDRKEIELELKKLSKQRFYCFEDADKAMQSHLATKSKYHTVDASVVETPKYKRGRPTNGEKQIDRIFFGVTGRVEEKPNAVEKFKQEAGCFVLLTNVAKEGKMARNSLEVLKAYKDQHGIEQNFGFLKDPVIVNSIFLKKPERIEVLGLVLLLSLLIWRLLERAMRNFIEKSGQDLPGWKNRRTRKPTSFMLGTKFAGVIVLKIDGERQLSKPLTSQQKEYLHALGVRCDVFTIPKNE